ncbi:MAG TPA: YggT family protein [Candidatus Saccharimonadales bacterium]|nr:YggT family protein [Candidatus Saccharimonadales bacterium]
MAERYYDPRVKAPGFLKFSKVIVWLLYLWILFGIIMLVLRVFLLAFSANTATGFAHFVINTSDDYLQPFRGIFPPHKVGDTGYLDVSALFAIIILLFVAWGFNTLISYIQDKIDLSKDTQQHEIDEAKLQRRRQQTTAKTTRPPRRVAS